MPWGIWQFRQSIERRIAANAAAALLAAPELSIYRLEVEAHQDRVTLHGRVPNQYLRNLAEQVAKTSLSNLPSDLPIDNQIIAVRIPPDPTQTASEVERAIATFNQLDGIKIRANFANGKVTVTGSAPSSIDAQRISQSLSQIPGVDSAIVTIDSTPPVIKTKIFFPSESAQITAKEAQKLKQVKEFIRSHPKYHLKIIGGSDRTGETEINLRLALERAQAVKAALVAQGVEPQRLQAASRAELSISEGEPEWTSRRVEFEIIKPK
ncbi:MAG: OmpA family protein [Pseudanabaena sp. RU_4_16]|nr:OmpA family protein [Pseudanabaena sp. RU_4_16]